MVIAALATFTILVIAWLLAPDQDRQDQVDTLMVAEAPLRAA